jgi:hypothetical protein
LLFVWCLNSAFHAYERSIYQIIYIYYNTLYSQPFVDTALVAYPYDPYGTLENHGSPVMFHLETMEA